MTSSAYLRKTMNLLRSLFSFLAFLPTSPALALQIQLVEPHLLRRRRLKRSGALLPRYTRLRVLRPRVLRPLLFGGKVPNEILRWRGIAAAPEWLPGRKGLVLPSPKCVFLITRSAAEVLDLSSDAVVKPCDV